MPSVTRIRQIVANSPDHVGVQVPLSFEIDGVPGMATAKIERTDNGRWFARVDGVDQRDNAILSEAISSAVESRRPRLLKHDIDSLLERRERRMAEVGHKAVPVPTSFIEAVAYDNELGVMGMDLARSGAHGYVVSRAVFAELLAAPDPGAANNRLIKGSNKVPARRCDDCGRFTFAEASGDHTCS